MSLPLHGPIVAKNLMGNGQCCESGNKFWGFPIVTAFAGFI